MSQTNFVSGQLFLMDFDGEKWDRKKNSYVGTNISFESIKQRAEDNNLQIAFAYKTLSCPEGEIFYKFRICFVFEQIITDIVVANYIYKALGEIFPECDSACLDVSRMFLGGKELIYINSMARFDLMQLNFSLQRSLGKTGHYKRDFQTFMKKHDIDEVNGTAAIGYYKDISIFGNICDSPNIFILGGGSISPIFYLKKSKRITEGVLQKKRTSNRKTKLSIVDHMSVCRLLSDYFNSESELDHNERFMLLTNLQYLSKGSELFFEILERDYEPSTVKRWRADKTSIQKYSPKSCSKECRYYEECHRQSTFKNLLLKMKNDRTIRIEDSQAYSDIDTATIQLKENLSRAFCSDVSGFHLIKAQTALGKTTQIINLVIENSDKRFLIAEPLNTLKMEVYNDLALHGVQAIYTASVRDCVIIPQDIKDQYMELHQKGMHREAKSVIAEFVEVYRTKNPDAKAAILELERLLEGIEGCEDRVVVTTHAMLVNMTEEQLKKFDSVIIDEDILYLQLLSNTKSVSKMRVEKLAESGDSNYSQMAKKMLSAREGQYYKSSWYSPYINDYNQTKINDDYMEDYSDDYSDVVLESDDNINDLKTAGAYVLENGVYHYLCISKLPKMKYIVLTATYNEEIYQAYFKESLIIVYPSVTVKYKGKLIQYTYYSLGRGDLSKRRYIYDFIQKNLGNIEKISFMSEEKDRNLNSKGIHFGNAVGVNCFKGKDIAIIGTPYKNNKAYLLPCCYLYGPECVNGDGEKRHALKRVDYKGKNFLITTFQNESLKIFQMYSLESELEQCIGRARLLRCDCTVYLFSAFPCEQAELITSDYLIEYKDGEEDQRKSDPLVV